MATSVVTNAYPQVVSDLAVTAVLYPVGVSAQTPLGAAVPSSVAVTIMQAGVTSWSVALERTDTMTPPGMVWQITETSAAYGMRTVSYITVPAGGGTLTSLLVASGIAQLALNSSTAVTSVAGRSGAISLTEADIASLSADLAAKAPLASPTFTGIVTVGSLTAASLTATGTATGSLLDKGGAGLNVKAYGAKADARMLVDAQTVVTAGSTNLYHPSAAFTAADVGKSVWLLLRPAVLSNANLTGTITSIPLYAALDVAIPAGTVLTLGKMSNPGLVTVQSFTVTSAGAAAGATSIPVNSQAVVGTITPLTSITSPLLTTTIAAVVDGYNVTLAAAPTIGANPANAWAFGYAIVGTDETAAVQSAIDAAYANALRYSRTGASRVIISGACLVSGLVLKPYVTLESSRGDGWLIANPRASGGVGAVIGSAKGASGGYPVDVNGPTVGTLDPYHCTLTGLRIHGARWWGGSLKGIELISGNNDSFFNPSPTPDPFLSIFDVLVEETGGDGVTIGANMRMSSIGELHIRGVQGNGLVALSTDTQYAACSSGVTSGHAVTNVSPYANGQSWHGTGWKMKGFKAWYAQGDGFHIEMGASAPYFFGLNGVEAQDNYGFGVAIFNAHSVALDVICGGNTLGALTLGTKVGGGFNTCSYNNITIQQVQGDRITENFGITLDGTNVTNNSLRLISDPLSHSGGYAAVQLLNGATLATNRVWYGNGHPVATAAAVTASGALTPDLYAQEMYAYTLNGNVTSVTPANFVAGSRMTLEFTQDGTGGRTVSWTGGTFAQSPRLATAANAVSTFTFVNVVSDTTSNWVLISATYSDSTGALLAPIRSRSASAVATPSATINTYGAFVSIVPTTGYVQLFAPAYLAMTFTNVSAETLTVNLRFTYSDGTTNSNSGTTTTTNTAQILNDILKSYINRDGQYCTKVEIQCQSTKASSTATATFILNCSQG